MMFLPVSWLFEYDKNFVPLYVKKKIFMKIIYVSERYLFKLTYLFVDQSACWLMTGFRDRNGVRNGDVKIIVSLGISSSWRAGGEVFPIWKDQFTLWLFNSLPWKIHPFLRGKPR